MQIVESTSLLEEVADPFPSIPPPAPMVREHRSPRQWLGLASIAAVAVLPAVAFGLVRTRRPTRTAALAGIGLGVGLGLFRWQLQRLFTEQAAYEVEDRIGDIEIRRYAPQIVLETTVTHRSWDESLDEGFGRLARYLRDEHVAMTVPVTVTEDGGGITVRLVMPKNAVLLVDPRDERLTLREVPARRVAARRYIGRYDGQRAHDEQHALVRDLDRLGLSPRGDASFAGYDPPSTLAPLRRIEALVEIA